MEISKIKRLIKLLEQSDLSEIEVSSGDETVRISRGTHAVMPAQPAHPAPSHTIDLSVPHTESATSKETTAEPKGQHVKSPIVGTAFLAPAPGLASFVEIGQRVAVGETLCIVEAMKMFNKIEADVAGVVVAVLVENNQPVEFNQPLFIIDDTQ